MKAQTQTMSGLSKAAMVSVFENMNRESLRNICKTAGIPQGRTKDKTIDNLVAGLKNSDVGKSMKLCVECA